jgi:DNA recombination protein RmuC
MEYLIPVIVAIAGIIIGFLAGALRSAAATRGADALVAQARSALDLQRSRTVDLERQLAETVRSAQLRESALNEAHDKYVGQIRGDQETLRREFQALSAETLKASQEQLLAVAQERLTRERHVADAELAKREQSVKTMVEPIARALAEVQKQTSETDKNRAEGQAALAQQVHQMLTASERLDKKTSDFINTLRRSDVRGNWGEVQLRRVVELSGMVHHVDFEEQENVKDGEGKNLRPDMTIKLAGGRTIVVDSKVALAALLEAFETEDEVVRAERLLAHARHVKKHVDDLSSKKYWDMFDSAPEFVVMFVPSEAFYQSALEQDPSLQEYAFAKRVVIATPTTLVAMLRTVAHAWKEDTLAKNAQQVLATGKELYDRLITMGGHLSRVGRALDNAGKAYNATVASMESRVLVSARKFGEMQEISGVIEESAPVHLDIRQIAASETAGERDSTD